MADTRCPSVFLHEDVEPGGHFFLGDHLNVTEAVSAAYSAEDLRAALQYLRDLAKRFDGLHYEQTFLNARLPDETASIGESIIFSDNGMIDVSFQHEVW
jgi:hypothetical protein